MYDEQFVEQKVENDACMGKRRPRTAYIAIMIFFWSALSIPYLYNQMDEQKDKYDLFDQAKELNGKDIYDQMSDTQFKIYVSFVVGLTGSLLLACGSIVLFLLMFCCHNKCLNLLPGICYLLGAIFMYTQAFLSSSVTEENNPYKDELMTINNQNKLREVCEILLPATVAFMAAFDGCLGCWDKEFWRLFSNLLNLAIFSVCLAEAYFYFGGLDYENKQMIDEVTQNFMKHPTKNGSFAIAMGYSLVFIVAALYIFLYLFTCCTCNCKDSKFMRIVFAILLIISSIVLAFGYFFTYFKKNIRWDDSIYNTSIPQTIGYVIFIVLYTLGWAVDFALDDFKEVRQKRKPV